MRPPWLTARNTASRPSRASPSLRAPDRLAPDSPRPPRAAAAHHPPRRRRGPARERSAEGGRDRYARAQHAPPGGPRDEPRRRLWPALDHEVTGRLAHAEDPGARAPG